MAHRGGAHAGDSDLSGLAVALVYRYDDDEDGSPSSLTLHVDERGGDAQRAALQRVFLDELRHLPWIRNARHVIGVQTSDRVGHELVADELVVADGPFAWELSGNCAYEADFDYRSG